MRRMPPSPHQLDLWSRYELAEHQTRRAIRVRLATAKAGQPRSTGDTAMIEPGNEKPP